MNKVQNKGWADKSGRAAIERGIAADEKLLLVLNKEPKKKSVTKRAWVVLEADGTFRKVFFSKSAACINVSSYAGEYIKYATLTYTLK